VGTGEAFGVLTRTGINTISPVGIVTAEAFGTLVRSGVLTVLPVPIASMETFGTPSLGGITTVSPVGLASALAFGSPSIGNNKYFYPDAIASLEAFGTITITVGDVQGNIVLVATLAPRRTGASIGSRGFFGRLVSNTAHDSVAGRRHQGEVEGP
jgi:hypothetical protein